MPKMVGFEVWETIGMAPLNPRALVKIPITPEMAQKLEEKAEAEGLTLDEYLDKLCEESRDAPETNQSPIGHGSENG